MKKCIVVVVVLFALILAGCGSKGEAGAREPIYYGKSVKVDTIDEQHNCVGFIDWHGDVWYWYCDTTTIPWRLGEYAILVMWDAGTDYAFDDEIISITTEGLLTTTITK